MAANAENIENPVVQKDQDENNGAQVSSEQNVFPVRKVSEELDRVVKEIRQLPGEVENELADARIAGKYRNQLRKVLENQVNRASERLERLKASATRYKLFGDDIFQTLYDKGIESVQDWNEYVDTAEHDEELIAEIREMFQTDVTHIRGVLRSVQSSHTRTTCQVEQKQSEEKMDVEEISGQLNGTIGSRDYVLNRESIQVQTGETWTSRQQIGVRCEPRSRQPSVRLERPDTMAGQDALNFMAWVQTNACVGPGVFKGNKNENFDEFIRRFKRKYGTVGFDDQTLLEILIDDHLEGRAKSVVLALPRSVREQGFEVVVEELRRMLTNDSTAGRLRALTELRCLKRRVGQSVADFCGVLEHLGRQANPSCSIKDRSLEYAQILLDNLTDWPEQIQLLSTLHGVDPSEAYDSVKQLALTNEQSRAMWAPSGSKRRDEWRERSAAYRQAERNWELEPEECEDGVHYERRAGPREENSEGEVRRPRLNELGVNGNIVGSRGERPRQSEGSEHRRCYNCQRIGHIGRDCPSKRPQVNQIAGKPSRENAPAIQRSKEKEAEIEKQRISSIITAARSLGVRCEKIGRKETPLVGKMVSAKVRLLGMKAPAILDTGSMVSIMPVGLLARAQKAGFDVDGLEVLPKEYMVPVFDASGNSMAFLGAVKVDIELEGGGSGEVAFHISDRKEGELLLGTNALEKLGVQVVLTPRGSEVQNEDPERVPNGSGSRHMMVESEKVHVAQSLHTVAKVHDMKKEFSDRMCRKMEPKYDSSNKGEQRKPPRVRDRVLSPKGKAVAPHQKWTGEGAGTVRVRETGRKTAVIEENTEPIRGRCNMHKRGKNPDVRVQKITSSYFRGAEERSKSETGHLKHGFKDRCIKDAKPDDLKSIQFAWERIVEMWTSLEKSMEKLKGPGRLFQSSGTRTENRKFCVSSAHQSRQCRFVSQSAQYREPRCCTKPLERLATSNPLSELKRQEFVSMRTSTTQGGGMWHGGGRTSRDRSDGDRPPKRRSLGGNR